MNRARNIGGNEMRDFKIKLSLTLHDFLKGRNGNFSNFTGGLDARLYNNAVKDRIKEFKK
jgi:hypothetical protein